MFLLFPIEKPKLQHLTLPSRSTQGHHLYKLVELESPLLQSKFQDHRTSGSGEDDFQRLLPYMGLAAIKVNRGSSFIYFVELESPMLHAKFQDHRTSGSGEENF